MTETHEATAGGTTSPGRPAATETYWERVRRIAAEAPPLTDEQRAIIRCAFHTARSTRAEAA